MNMRLAWIKQHRDWMNLPDEDLAEAIYNTLHYAVHSDYRGINNEAKKYWIYRAEEMKKLAREGLIQFPVKASDLPKHEELPEWFDEDPYSVAKSIMQIIKGAGDSREEVEV